MNKLSVVMNTKNSEKYLERSLASIKNLADEIIVVDMASTDGTREIAQKFGAKIYQYPEPEIGNVEVAREWSFNKAGGEWILLLDSDEEIPETLVELIRKKIGSRILSELSSSTISSLADSILLGARDTRPKQVRAQLSSAAQKNNERANNSEISFTEDVVAYRLPRQNIIWGKVIKKVNWWPDYQLRLWKKGAVEWEKALHPQSSVKGKCEDLPAEEKYAIKHHNYQTIEQFVDKGNKYSSLMAEAKKTDTPIISVQLWKSFWNEFYNRAFLYRGIEEGNHGMTLSLLQASVELEKTAKEWQRQGFREHNLSTKEMKTMRKEMQQTAAYWWADLLAEKATGLEKIYWQVRRKLKI